jgi:hypothetical protein
MRDDREGTAAVDFGCNGGSNAGIRKIERRIHCAHVTKLHIMIKYF